jgi:hypothetical protein
MRRLTGTIGWALLGARAWFFNHVERIEQDLTIA